MKKKFLTCLANVLTLFVILSLCAIVSHCQDKFDFVKKGGSTLVQPHFPFDTMSVGDLTVTGTCTGCGGGTTINPTNGKIPVRSSSTAFADAAASDVVNLFSACSGTQYLGADGACHTASGAPGGSPTYIQYNVAGAFAGDSAFTHDTITDLSLGTASNPLLLQRTITKADGSQTLHMIDSTGILAATNAVIENTAAGGVYGRFQYNTNNASSGCGDCGVFFARSSDIGPTQGTVAQWQNYFSDFQSSINPGTSVTAFWHFRALNGTITSNVANPFTQFGGYRYEIQTVGGSSSIGTETAFEAQMPGSADTRKTTFFGLRTAGCTDAGNYDAMCIDGGQSLYKQGIKQTYTFDTTVAAPLTTAKTPSLDQSTFVQQAGISGFKNVKSLMTFANGAGGSQGIVGDFTADNGGVANPTLMTALSATCSNSGGATATKCVAFIVPSLLNSGATMTDYSQIELGTANVGNVTNQPQFLKQSDANAIATTAGVVYENGNRLFVTTDFTGPADTALHTITGLSWSLPRNLAVNVSVSCYLRYTQATANAAVGFGISDSVAPTQINASGVIYTSASVLAAGHLEALTTTTATAIVSGTPSATATVFDAEIHAFIEQPSGTAGTAAIAMSTANASDLVTIKRGSYCSVGS